MVYYHLMVSLADYGLYDPSMLAREAHIKRDFLVDNLLFKHSVNIAVGDSGLGKTALLVSLGVAVATGQPWLGRRTFGGPVLYVDGESPLPEFYQMLHALSLHNGHAAPPSNFYVYSPQWDTRPSQHIASEVKEDLRRQIKLLSPALVIVDPLRLFFPLAETKSDEAVKMITFQRDTARDHGTTWITLHHRRKTDSKRTVDLEENPQAWLQEAAGTRALINNTDTRLGIDQGTMSDLMVAGFTRIIGAVPPLHVKRVSDGDGQPQGYCTIVGIDKLQPAQQEAYRNLPDTFRFSDAQVFLSTPKATSAFLDAAEQFGVLEKLKPSGYRKLAVV